MRHKLAHLFGSFKGQIISIKIDTSDTHWMGYQCEVCGDITSLCRPLGMNWDEYKRYEKRKNSELNDVSRFTD